MRVRISGTNGINATIKKKPKVFVNQSGMITQKLSDLFDVDLTGTSDGDLLIYDDQREKFVASKLLEKQEINGGHF
jgi:peptidyl-tRNA hydrolase